jgi:hypothetical protein
MGQKKCRERGSQKFRETQSMRDAIQTAAFDHCESLGKITTKDKIRQKTQEFRASINSFENGLNFEFLKLKMQYTMVLLTMDT